MPPAPAGLIEDSRNFFHLFYPQALAAAKKKARGHISGRPNIARGKRKDFDYATGGRIS